MTMKFVCALLLLVGSVAAHAGHGHRPPAPKSVADLVIANKDKGFGILLEAVLAADASILKALSDPNLRATVFAPNDKAFAVLLSALKISKAELLGSCNQALLNAVLTYHVLGKPVSSSQIPRFPGTSVQTLLPGKNGKLTVRRGGKGVVRISTTSGGQSAVVSANLKAGRAIVHVINRVLVPKL